MALEGPSNPWDRQEGEPRAAWAAFVAYRDTDPSTRSIPNTAKLVPQVAETLRSYAKDWGWVERADLWDAHLDRRKQQTIEAVHDKHARKITSITDKTLDKLDQFIENLDTEDMTNAQIVQYFPRMLDSIVKASSFVTGGSKAEKKAAAKKVASFEEEMEELEQQIAVQPKSAPKEERL